ncbi:hypothetical protein Efla_001040 [Eimeria flavescens]
MGAVCSKKPLPGEGQARKAAVEVTDGPSDPSNPQPQIAASAVCPSTKTPEKATEFVTGEGDGVYLMLEGMPPSDSLVQQYAHSKPEVGDSDILLLQVKPPVYVEIKESRFVLQNGKRTLKQGITAAMSTADGQKKVCEAVMEFLRLISVYSGYFHTYPGMARAPFSVLLVVQERHKPSSIKDDGKGQKIVTSVAAEGHLAAPETDAPKAEEPKTEEKEGQAEGAQAPAVEAEAAKQEAEGDKTDQDEQTESANKAEPEKIFHSPSAVIPDAPALEVLKQVVVLRHLQEGRSPNVSLLHFIVVVPMGKEQAEKEFQEGLVLCEEGIEVLEKQVDALNGLMASTAAVKEA